LNYGPLIFLAAFFALTSSWYGFVLTPQMQVGRLHVTNSLAGATYPLSRPGQAREGLDVYRANGCAYCHSQQVVQSAVTCDLILTEAGTNQSKMLSALSQIDSSLTPAQTTALLARLPKTVLHGVKRETADAAIRGFKDADAKYELWIVPVGPDISRGWGKRRSVAQDFLYDYPVMLGVQRIGPDLANVGSRLPDANWHLLHLYAPRLKEKNSVMPPYRFLFETRDIRQTPSPDALPLSGELAPPAGKEIVPKPEAKALVAYLMSLRENAPLYVAPFTVPAPPPAGTNAPGVAAAASTNPVPTTAK